jgi:predicted secreted protein
MRAFFQRATLQTKGKALLLCRFSKENAMRYLKVCIFAVLLALLLESCGQAQQIQKQPVEKSIRYSGLVESVGLEVGELLEIVLPVDISSNYIWKAAFYNPSVLELKGAPEFVISSTDAGEEELQKLHFKAKDEGETELVLLYQKPSDVQEADSFTVTVCVK